MGKVPKVR